MLAPLYPHTDLARAAVGWGAKPVSASTPDPQECESDVARAPEGDHDQAAHAPAKSRRAGEAFSASPAPTKAGKSGLPVCQSFGTCRGGCRQAGRFFFRPGRQAAGLPRARAQRESGSRERADTKRRDLRHVPLGLGGGGRVRGPCLCAKALSLRQRVGELESRYKCCRTLPLSQSPKPFNLGLDSMPPAERVGVTEGVETATLNNQNKVFYV